MKRKKKQPTDAEVLRLAAALLGFVMTTQAADTLLEIMKVMQEKGDQFSVDDASRIEYEMERKYKKLSIEFQKK